MTKKTSTLLLVFFLPYSIKKQHQISAVFYYHFSYSGEGDRTPDLTGMNRTL
jgi:hypothetical protein